MIQINYSSNNTMDYNNRQRRPGEDRSPSSVYNQRTQGRNQGTDFRQQIQSREDEIFLLSQTTEHLRQKLDQTVERNHTQHYQPPRSEPKHIAPLRVKDGSRSRSPMRPHRDTSPATLQKAPTFARDHIASLQNDNASLMRRLNLVLQELERVTQEKNQLLEQVDHSSKDIDEMHRVINGEDNTDKINRYMQDDLGVERAQNNEVRDRIKDAERTSANLVQELKKLQQESENRADENTHCDGDLAEKVARSKELENEHYFAVEKLKQADRAILECRNEEQADNRHKQGLQHKLGVLINERNELLQKLEQLTSQYDETVKEITADRRSITHANKKQSNLVTAKILFTLFEQLQRNKRRQALDEMKNYCVFDQRCQKKLGAFASTGQRQGQKLMKMALQRWFRNALEPTDKIAQSQLLAEKGALATVKTRAFHLWREALAQKLRNRQSQQEAAKVLWNYRERDTRVELARYFTIWRDKSRRFEMQKLQLQKLIWRKYFNKLNQAFNTWAGFSQFLDSQVRLQMLAAEFTQKNYQTAIFGNMKLYAMESKRKKSCRQLQAFKAWKDYHNKRKFFFHSNLATGQLLKQNSTWLQKACFDALNKHREASKFGKTHEALVSTQAMQSDLATDISETETKNQFRDRSYACNVLKTMYSKQVVSYLLRWKEETERAKQVKSLRIKQRILKVYTSHLRQAFSLWKKQGATKVNFFQSQEIISESGKQKELTNQILEQQKNFNEEKKIKDCSGNRGINKVLRRMQRRQLENAVARWRDTMNAARIRESGAETILKRIRVRFFRQAFDRYVKSVEQMKKEELHASRCGMFLLTQDERTKKACFEAIRLFVTRFAKARDTMRRLDAKLNVQMQKQGFKKWQKWSQKKLEKRLKAEQNTLTDKVVEMNEDQGKLFSQSEGQKQAIGDQNKQMTKQARRIISNAFARFYYTGLTRGFERWREFTEFENHRARVLKRIEFRLRRNQLYFVKSCFKNWMLAADVHERSQQLRKEEFRVEDTKFQLEQQTQKFSASQQAYQVETEEFRVESEKQSQRYQKSVALIIENMDQNHFMSRQKYIFQQWAMYVKRQKQFVTQTVNVINKSIWKEGFEAIRTASRENTFNAKKERVLNRFRLKFWKRTCGTAFSTWRENSYKQVLQLVHETQQQTVQVMEAHAEQKAQFKRANCDKAVRHLDKQNMRYLWTGWTTVINLMKFHRVKREGVQKNLGMLQARNAVRKWQSRLVATKRARQQAKKMKEAMRLMRLRMCFDSMVASRDMHNGMTNRLNNFAKVMDHQQIQFAFEMLNNFVRSKEVSHRMRKEQACRDLLQKMDCLLKREQQRTLCQLKEVPLEKYKNGLKQFQAIVRNLTSQQKRAFQQWKAQARKMTVAKEMQEEGPVREQIWQLHQQKQNLVDFMKVEGYTPDDILKLEKFGQEQRVHLMHKVKLRLEHNTEARSCVPAAFDRWRKFVAFRKMMRYYLNLASNRGEYLKADMASAFTQWKNAGARQQKAFAAVPRSKLETHVMRNCEQIDVLADDIAEREAHLGHLDIQREELMENFIKGQKLALALWVGHKRKALYVAFTRWVDNSKDGSKQDNDVQMQENVRAINEMKDRIRGLEEQNANFDEENADLRQLTVDGYTMAQNAQKLEAEREQLSVDLADKATTIKKLLMDNELLKERLRNAQDDANNILRSIKKSEGDKFSPMVKSGY